MARQRTDLMTLWRQIEGAGGVESYVQAQLVEHGYLIERRDTARMSKRELATYKKQLKDEAEQKRQLRKDAWKAYHANHIVHLGEGVFWNDFTDYDKWDLEDAEQRAAENELPAFDKPLQLAEALGLTISELRWLSFHRRAAEKIHYRRFTIPKRGGGERAIWAPLPKLKAAQSWILRNIVERLLVHGAAHGFLAGRSIYSNAKAHCNSRVILKMDLRDFFPTVTFPRVRGVFRKAGYREQIATLLALLCTEPPRKVVEQDGKTYFVALGERCLPQGAPTSPGITNVLCLRMDRRLQGLAKSFGWRYTRYADDLTFSLPDGHKKDPRLGVLLGKITKVVEEEGFCIHTDKTRFARSGSRQKVTGLVVNGEGPPRVPRKLKRQIRAAIHNLRQGKPLHDGETPDTIRGYAAFVYMCQRQLGRTLLDAIDEVDRV